MDIDYKSEKEKNNAENIEGSNKELLIAER
jgi:hypothetical protein